MQNNLFVDVLKVINETGTVLPLLGSNGQYRSVFEIFDRLQKEDYIVKTPVGVWKLTEKGKQALNGPVRRDPEQMNNRQESVRSHVTPQKKTVRKKMKIDPYDQYRVEKIGIEDVFLP